MTKDTRPDQHTRHIDIPIDPIEQKRDDLKADRLDLTAQDYTRQGRSLSADLLTGHAMALRGLDPITASPVVRTAHTWAHCERAICDDADWAQELVSKAATAMNFRDLTTADFLRGVAAALGGLTVAPVDASPTFRMGLKAVQECQRGRPQHTELAVAAPSEGSRVPEPKVIKSDHVHYLPPDLDGPVCGRHPWQHTADPELVTCVHCLAIIAGASDPLEHEPTRPHSVPTAIEDQATSRHVEANPTPPPLLDVPIRRTVQREPDAPSARRGQAVVEDGLTRARLIPRTEQLKAPKR